MKIVMLASLSMTVFIMFEPLSAAEPQMSFMYQHHINLMGELVLQVCNPSDQLNKCKQNVHIP